ncbi:unnamed protein product [Medioppia subpectinata]|uniref:Protein kinase domain-containing protein n=1 Tax=Medioppia subpectinata TaxID=1979941 RepID=A0A7R9KLZ2_9ACAR|nr:unnamed protein product [Medioppia subpectinata]CAG2105709.1 unnamed protein product [Medioppia subpectinata]
MSRCGYIHTLVLTSDGRVYAWGGNGLGQIGCGDNTEYICTPNELHFGDNHKIKSIHASYGSSFAITSIGHVLSWGDNRGHELGLNIDDERVFKPRLITTLNGVKELCYINAIKSNEDKTIESFHISDVINKYKSQFIEILTIESGGFGTVYKVKHRWDDKIYAVKRIQFEDENTKYSALNEVKMLAKLDSNFIVKYYDSWIEDPELYIQMEYCTQSLRTVIEDKPRVFGRQSVDTSNTKPMDIIEYFISCEIFRELLQCVQYLHELQPPIIHRDIKPENFLISYNGNNRFIKLCDFHLATNQDRTALTRGVGSPKYMAPDVGLSQSYNFKVDIYSLGLIGFELFEINSKEYN